MTVDSRRAARLTAESFIPPAHPWTTIPPQRVSRALGAKPISAQDPTEPGALVDSTRQDLTRGVQTKRQGERTGMIWQCPTCGEPIEAVVTPPSDTPVRSDAQEIILDRSDARAVAIPCGHAIDISD